jgi:hypothetical protein
MWEALVYITWEISNSLVRGLSPDTYSHTIDLNNNNKPVLFNMTYTTTHTGKDQGGDSRLCRVVTRVKIITGSSAQFLTGCLWNERPLPFCMPVLSSVVECGRPVFIESKISLFFCKNCYLAHCGSSASFLGNLCGSWYLRQEKDLNCQRKDDLIRSEFMSWPIILALLLHCPAARNQCFLSWFWD